MTNRVQRRRTLDWVEPVDAAALLPDGLLLDGTGAHPEARHGILGLNRVLEARFHGGRMTVAGPDGTEHRTGEPLRLLQDLVEAHRWDLDEAHPFTGGFIGYFGYGFSQAIEPTLDLKGADTPDAVLHLCTDAAVFDRAARTVTLYAADPDAATADARLEAYAARLKDSPPRGSVPEAIWSPSLDQPQFETAVTRLRAHILDGDLFQANLATRFEADLDADPVDLLGTFQAGNPSPYMALLRYPDHAIVSSSPEQLFAVQDGVIRTRPIAGTRGRGETPSADAALEAELRADPKERAEHTMLVDLLRNDIAKVCRPGTTRVTEVMSVERYQHVMHLVSCVEGDLCPDTGFADWLAALFPGGTITGAPKHRACMRIEEAEPVPRGPYTGSAGFLSWSHNAHWNILIRTLVLKDGQARVHAGSGIVADSVPAHEWHEAGRKARSLLLGGGTPRGDAGTVSRHGSWQPPVPGGQVTARVLLIDNYDSFVHNLADYAALCGATVHVMRNDEDLDEAMSAFDPTHVVLGPGPGWPRDSGATLEAARRLERPTLGVCLGHQAMAEAHGGAVRVVAPVHGKTSQVHHKEPLFAHLPSPFTATRYHSLVVDAPPDWAVSAWLEDGTVMAMHHPTRPAWGVQFHPESLLTEGGLEILLAFLRT